MLRSTARTLADAGCTEREIMAVTGHVTSRTVTMYVKSADQSKRADQT